MEILSEHIRQGRFEELLLIGRPGVFNSDEAVVHIIESMFNQHTNRRELDLLATQQAEIIRGWTWAA